MCTFIEKDFFNKYKNKIVLCCFIFLNAVKLVYFNYSLSINIEDLPKFIILKFLVNIVLVTIIYLILFKFKLRKTAIIFYILQFVYIFAHMCYFKYFNNYLHIKQVFMLMKEGITALRHLNLSLNFSVILLIIDIPFFTYLVKKNNIFLSYDGIFMMIGPIIFIMIAVNDFLFPSTLYTKHFLGYSSENYVVKTYGTFVNDVISIMGNYNDDEIIKKFRYGKEIKNVNKDGDNSSIIILQLESIDSNIINEKYNGKYIAPYLHYLTTQSVYYPYTMSYHEGGGTSDAEFSILNSIEPLQSDIAMKLRTYSYPNSVIKQFRKNGYSCRAFHGNDERFYNRGSAFHEMQFDEFYDIDKMNLHHVGWGAPDKEVLDFTIDMNKCDSKPFLSYIISMTSHTSFKVVYNYYINHDYDNVKDELTKDYYNSVSYVDDVLKDYIYTIRNMVPNAYIFILGDHTPPIEDGKYLKSAVKYDEKYFEFVPLFILTPDNKIYQEKSKVASFLDIAPTILNASGIEYEYKTDGDDLLNFDNVNSKIPYKGGMYKRTELFNIIKNTN